MSAHRSDASSIGPAIVRLREAVGMTLERCAARAHINRTNLRRIEAGAGCNVRTLQDIAAALRVPAFLIFAEAEGYRRDEAEGSEATLQELFAGLIAEAALEERRDLAAAEAPCIVRSRVA